MCTFTVNSSTNSLEHLNHSSTATRLTSKAAEIITNNLAANARQMIKSVDGGNTSNTNAYDIIKTLTRSASSAPSSSTSVPFPETYIDEVNVNVSNNDQTMHQTLSLSSSPTTTSSKQQQQDRTQIASSALSLSSRHSLSHAVTISIIDEDEDEDGDEGDEERETDETRLSHRNNCIDCHNKRSYSSNPNQSHSTSKHSVYRTKKFKKVCFCWFALL